MPDVLEITLDGLDVEIEETIAVSGSGDFLLPDALSNFAIVGVVGDGDFDTPDEYSNFVNMSFPATAQDSHRLSELLHLSIGGIPVLLPLTYKDNVSFLQYTANGSLSNLYLFMALLADFQGSASLFTYYGIYALVRFSNPAHFTTTSTANLSNTILLSSQGQVIPTHGLVLSDSVLFTSDGDLTTQALLATLLSLDANVNFVTSLAFLNQLNLTGAGTTVFQPVYTDEIGFSASIATTLYPYIATLLGIDAEAGLSLTDNAEGLNSLVYSALSNLLFTHSANLLSNIGFAVDADMFLIVPREVSTLTMAWYTVPAAISMHTITPVSICENNDIVYMALDDGIYVFGEEDETDTGLVYDFGDMSIPIFKRLEELFISGSFDQLKVAVDMDDARRIYQSYMNKIKFAKGYRGYNVKLFIEGLKNLFSMDFSFVTLSKRRRFGR